MSRKRNKRLLVFGWALLFVLGCGVSLVRGWGGSDDGWNGLQEINEFRYEWSFGDVLPGVRLSFDTKDMNSQFIDCHGNSPHIRND